MKAISLFSGAGIGESRLEEIGVEVVAANELKNDRAKLFEKLNQTPIVVGDICLPETKESVQSMIKENLDLLIATPPCQGVSIAGKNRSALAQSQDLRNYLIFDIVEMILKLEPKHVVLENVPQYLNLHLLVNGEYIPILQVLQDLLAGKYIIASRILNAADYGVPQNRRRSFIVLTHKSTKLDYSWPEVKSRKVSLEAAIGTLPTLEAGEVSSLPWHFARNHDPRQISWMQHTPTGKSAFENSLQFPQKKDGTRISAFATTYKRMSWSDPAPAITMRNDAISSQNNVHPGRVLSSGLFSDARVLTPRELLIVNGMNMDKFDSIHETENLIRRVLGEGIPPLLLNSVIKQLGEKT
jgi:DNA (cytosine-5)-methyltransferase 1